MSQNDSIKKFATTSGQGQLASIATPSLFKAKKKITSASQTAKPMKAANASQIRANLAERMKNSDLKDELGDLQMRTTTQQSKLVRQTSAKSKQNKESILSRTDERPRTTHNEDSPNKRGGTGADDSSGVHGRRLQRKLAGTTQNFNTAVGANANSTGNSTAFNVEQATQKRADKKFLELMHNFESNRLNG